MTTYRRLIHAGGSLKPAGAISISDLVKMIPDEASLKSAGAISIPVFVKMISDDASLMNNTAILTADDAGLIPDYDSLTGFILRSCLITPY